MEYNTSVLHNPTGRHGRILSHLGGDFDNGVHVIKVDFGDFSAEWLPVDELTVTGYQ